MNGPVNSVGVDGLGRLAHAVRRSTALYVAAQITGPEDSVEELLSVADRLASWIKSGVPDPNEQQDQPGFPSFPSR